MTVCIDGVGNSSLPGRGLAVRRKEGSMEGERGKEGERESEREKERGAVYCIQLAKLGLGLECPIVFQPVIKSLFVHVCNHLERFFP